MNQKGLYGERKQESWNRKTIIDYYWALCKKVGSHSERDVRESYILALLLPHARSNGSRKVFCDATLAKPKRMKTFNHKIVSELEQILKNGIEHECTEVEFRDRTANLLGPPQYEQEVFRLYKQYCQEIFDEGCEFLHRDSSEGFSASMERWAEKMRKIGRRRGNEKKKQVLDILSYEARAAFLRCYSCVWVELIRYLYEKEGLSDAEVEFHKLWHLVIKKPAAETDEALFFPFHGHVFGLHPACGTFIQTESGGMLLEDCINNPKSAPAYQRLLNGFLMAMFQYAERHNTYAMLRKKGPDFIDPEKLENFGDKNGESVDE